MVGATHQSATGDCMTGGSGAPACTSGVVRTQLNSRRAGGALRIMSGGESVRFTSSVGVGAVSHDLYVPGMVAKGFDAYFSLEAGAQVNIDHFLVEWVAFGGFDSASSIKSGNYRPYLEGNGIQMFGLSLRVGWSEWTPRDAH